MERRIQFKAEGDNLLLAKMDKRRGNFDASIARAGADEFAKCLIIRRPAVGIARTVLLHRADENGAGAEDFRPAYCGREEMRVAKWDVGHRNGFADRLMLRRFGHGDG